MAGRKPIDDDRKRKAVTMNAVSYTHLTLPTTSRV